MSGKPEGNNAPGNNASEARPRGVEDPRHAEKLHAREPGDPVAAQSLKAMGRRENAMSGKSLVYGGGESNSGIVLRKQPNGSERSPEEVAEGRPLTEENARQPNLCRTRSWESGPSGLERVREAARKDKKQRFTALLHHVTKELLRESYYKLKKQAAPGVDGVTWEEYGDALEDRLTDLHGRIHRGAYRAQASRRVWIPKADGRQRPLGIAALEDKIAQYAVGTVLTQIWEEDFLGFSYGFRPGRSQHEALDALWVGIVRKKVNWIIDLDIRSFFDKLQHDVLIRFVEHRIGDQRIVRLIQKWLKAGVMEEGKWTEAEEGSPQGAVISPLLANLYLHYALDLWAQTWRKKLACGDMIVVRYADDAVLGFQSREEAVAFLEQLRERLRKFGLELHPEKTRLIEFGRYATERRKQRGEGKPETFNFLGFTHICGVDQGGRFTVVRKTIGKRMAAKLKEVRGQLRRRMHESPAAVVKWLQQVVRGYFQYHAVSGNQQRLKAFRNEVQRGWYRVLQRRSQRSRLTWRAFRRLACLLPQVQILHPYPDRRFDARLNPR